MQDNKLDISYFVKTCIDYNVTTEQFKNINGSVVKYNLYGKLLSGDIYNTAYLKDAGNVKYVKYIIIIDRELDLNMSPNQIFFKCTSIYFKKQQFAPFIFLQ